MLCLSFNLLSSLPYIKKQFQVAEIYPYLLMCSSFISSTCFICFCVYIISINVYPFNSHLMDPSSSPFYICFFCLFIYTFFTFYTFYTFVVPNIAWLASPYNVTVSFCLCLCVHSIRRVFLVGSFALSCRLCLSPWYNSLLHSPCLFSNS